jgi:hypothetical protein
MRFNLKKAAAVFSVPLIGSALAVGAAALPASAATWQDTSLQVNLLHATSTNPAPPSVATTGTPAKITVTPASSGGTLSVNSGASHLPGSVTATVTGGVVTLTGHVVTPAPPTPITGTLVVDDASASGAVLAMVIRFGEIANTGALTLGNYYTDAPAAITRSYPVGGVQFSEVPTVTAVPSTAPALTPAPAYSFAYSGLPGGIVSNSAGRFTIAGSTAAPGTYGSVGVTATDQYGARTESGFQLVVKAQPVYVPGNYGDMVNPFGNGFDVYQQHMYAGAIIAGWTATKADPATHFIRLPGTVPGAYKFEYAPNGVATGLCVADPGGGWASDPLPDGLILTASNNGPWQQFIPQSNGTLKNVATGLIVSPNGSGAQLRGTAAATSWGGSAYTWTDYAHLPG